MVSKSFRLVPATSQQEGIWFYALTHGSSYWNFIDIRCYEGDLCLAALTLALKTVIARHSSLRTNFMLRNNELHQVISEVIAPGDFFECTRYEEPDPTDKDSIIRAEIQRIQQYEFDLEKEALLKLKILQFGSRQIFLLAISHIVLDEISRQIFWSELTECYNAQIGTDTKPKMDPVRQYADFSLDQKQFLSTAAGSLQKTYWLNKLSDDVPVLDLPFYRNRQEAKVYGRDIALSPELATNIRTFSLKKRMLYSSVFQAAYFLLLYKYSQKDRIMIGNIINGRGGAGKGKNDAIVGIFASTLLHIQQISNNESLLAFTGKVNEDLLRSFNNSDVPYDDWIRECPVRNKDSSLPLFQAAFNVIKTMGPDPGFRGMEQCPVREYQKGLTLDNQYDVNLFIINEMDKVTIRLEVRCSEKWQSMPELLLESYLHILHLFVYQSDKSLGDIDLITAGEHTMLSRFNDTGSEIPDPAVIHELFREQAAFHPGRTALIDENTALSYEDLDNQSDKMAGYLAALGIGKGAVVAILQRRSSLMITSMLAVLKAGAAYLPLDPDYPVHRLAYMLRDARAALVLTETALTVKIPEAANLLFTEDLPLTGSHKKINNINSPDDLAYLIYTSGSTGEPKGVMVEHKSVSNFIKGITDLIGFAGKKIYSLTTISFDIFVLESLLSLCSGATVVLANEEEQKNAAMAVDAIVANDIQLLQATPSRMKMLLKEGNDFLAGLSAIMIGGEAFPQELLDHLNKVYPGRIYNMYGPTETTVWSSVGELTGQNHITAGKPLINTRIHIIDEQARLQGIGVPAEICIGGQGVARGYWGLATLTAQKFIRHGALSGERIYKTGDIGRWTPGGELEIIGRNDSQVKIRGYRVELEDIAFHLKTHPEVKDAVVIAFREEQYDDLYAYYISENILEARQLRMHLRRMLPEFMIPSYFVHMRHFPLTPSNKIDRIALKNSKGPAGIKAFADYKNINGRLLTLWVGILQVDNDLFNERALDNFFESGGHSLKALSMLDAVEKEFHVRIPVRDFFKYPTLQFLNDKLIINN